MITLQMNAEQARVLFDAVLEAIEACQHNIDMGYSSKMEGGYNWDRDLKDYLQIENLLNDQLPTGVQNTPRTEGILYVNTDR